jgi:hypothetical protein
MKEWQGTLNPDGYIGPASVEHEPKVCVGSCSLWEVKKKKLLLAHEEIHLKL